MKKIFLIIILFFFSFNLSFATNLNINELKKILERIEKLESIVQEPEQKQILKSIKNKIEKILPILENKSFDEKNTDIKVQKIKEQILNRKLFSHLDIGLNDFKTEGEVTKLQKFLKDFVEPNLEVDGWFGNATRKAVEKFNQKYFSKKKSDFNPLLFFDKNEIQKNKIIFKDFLYWSEIDFISFKGLGRKTEIFCDGKKIDIFNDKNKSFFLVRGNKKQIYSFKNEKKFLEIIPVKAKRKITYVNLTKKTYVTKPSQEVLDRITEDRKLLTEAYTKAKKEKIFNGVFINPLDTKIISPFGKTRIFNHSRKSVHSGTDFRARTPLPVKAVNDGEVVMAGRDLYYCGKGIIVNHGLGIFSIYCHLSENKVKIGDKVRKGQIIGLTGATGRVSGPHLHLGVKFNGSFVNFEWLKRNSEILNEE